MSKFPEQTTGYNSGGYPLMYVGDGYALCGACAEKADKDVQKALVQRAHMEGAPIQCEECGTDIESAYGDPEDDE